MQSRDKIAHAIYLLHLIPEIIFAKCYAGLRACNLGNEFELVIVKLLQITALSESM